MTDNEAPARKEEKSEDKPLPRRTQGSHGGCLGGKTVGFSRF